MIKTNAPRAFTKFRRVRQFEFYREFNPYRKPVSAIVFQNGNVEPFSIRIIKRRVAVPFSLFRPNVRAFFAIRLRPL